jgi:hypothetical protein
MKQSKPGRSRYLEIGFWYEPNGTIHLTAKGEPGFHVAISDDPSKPNGHPTLFKRLAKCLDQQDASQAALSIVEQVTGGKLKPKR